VRSDKAVSKIEFWFALYVEHDGMGHQAGNIDRIYTGPAGKAAIDTLRTPIGITVLYGAGFEVERRFIIVGAFVVGH